MAKHCESPTDADLTSAINTFMFAIACVIWELRRERGIDQAHLAEHLSCSQSVVSRVERGDYEIPLRLMLVAAATFGLKASDFLVRAEGVYDQLVELEPKDLAALRLGGPKAALAFVAGRRSRT